MSNFRDVGLYVDEAREEKASFIFNSVCASPFNDYVTPRILTYHCLMLNLGKQDAIILLSLINRHHSP